MGFVPDSEYMISKEKIYSNDLAEIKVKDKENGLQEGKQLKMEMQNHKKRKMFNI